jgi:hypothetical protein
MPPNEAGGLGGDLAPDEGIRDTRLQAKAIRERWPMSQDVRIKVLKRLCGIIDPETEDGANAGLREVIAASRALLSADKLNLEQQRLDLATPPPDDEDDYVIDLSGDEDAEGREEDPPAA